MADFGLFALMQIMIATGMGLINGVFGTPLALVVDTAHADLRTLVGSFFLSATALGAVGVVATALVAWVVGATPLQLLLLSAAALGMWLRWFTRSLAVSLQQQREAALSDIVYAASSLAAVCLTLVVMPLSVDMALAIQVLACLGSLIPISRSLGLCVASLRGADTKGFASEYGRFGRWSTLMVVASEVVASVHAYGITLAFGAAAFAPIALANLMLRPHGVILTGLVVFERPRVVAHSRAGETRAVERDVSFMHVVLVGTWIANSSAVALLLLLQPQTVLNGAYDYTSVVVAAGLTCIVVLLRSLREPVIVALQAMSLAREAALLSLLSAAIAAPVTLLTLTIVTSVPALSLVGSAAGELVFLTLAAVLWRRSASRI